MLEIFSRNKSRDRWTPSDNESQVGPRPARISIIDPAIFSIQDGAYGDILLLAYTEHWHTGPRMGFDVESEIATVTRSQWFTGYQMSFALRSTVRIKLSLVLINAFPYAFLYSWNTHSLFS